MTQNDRLLEHLQRGHSITPLESWRDLGVYRLAARICELRQQGHDIHSEPVNVANRYGDTVKVARYSMYKRGQQELGL